MTQAELDARRAAVDLKIKIRALEQRISQPGPQGPPGPPGAAVVLPRLEAGDIATRMGVIASALTGPQGDRGLQGEQGVAGIPGVDGQHGRDGERGADGIPGRNGEHGIDGQRGEQGPRGDSGARGLEGRAGADGPPGIVWKGHFSFGTTYAPGDAVAHQGSSWIAKLTTGDTPSEGVFWDVVAQRGDNGPAGWASESSGGASTADAVSVAPGGNLESEDVQAALEELQGDIDNLGVTDGSLSDAVDSLIDDLADLAAANTGDQTSVTGNAGTATALQTARTINGTSFNGTANITVTDATKVALTGDETVAGVKTFSSTLRVTSADGIEVNNGTGNNNLIKNQNGSLTGIIQTDSGTSLTIYSNSFPVLKVGVGNAGCSTPYTFTVGGELEVTTAGNGVIVKSPNGTRYRVGVDNAGALTIAAA